MHVSKKSLLTAGHAQCLPFWTHQSGFQSIIRERCGKSHDALCETWYELRKTTWMYVLATNIVWYDLEYFKDLSDIVGIARKYFWHHIRI